MVDVNHNDEDETESFDLKVRCPGIAFDVGQKGFTRVLVVQRLADTVTEYDEGRGDDEKGQLEYFKNVLVGATPDDTVYQCVYLTDSPVGRGDLNDPKNRYPVPESRLVPFRAERADPVDNSSRLGPREAVQRDTLESLFDIAYAFGDAPDADALEAMAEHTGINSDVIQSAREAAHADATHDGETLTMGLDDSVAVDDDGGPDMELVEAGGESEDARDDPPEPPEDGGPDGVDDLSDGELGDFDPSGDV